MMLLVCDDSMMVKDNVEIVVQINGKVREKLYVPNGLSKEDFQNFVLDSEKTKELVKDKHVIKIIAVPNKLLNIVVKA